MFHHRRYLLLLLAGFSSLAQGGSLRSKKGQSGPSSGKGVEGAPPPTLSTDTECAATPPSLNGTCDADCMFLKIAEAGAQTVLGEIPIVGGFLSNLAGVFWPSSSGDEFTVFQDTLQYIDSKIADATSNDFLTDIQDDYLRLVANVHRLKRHIEDDTTDRYGLLDNTIIGDNCIGLNSDIVAKGPQTNPVSLLAALGNIGQSCLAMRIALVYHYNSTVGGSPQNSATVNTSKAYLDEWVQFYTDSVQNATQQALTWRMSQIESPTSSCGAGDDDGQGCSTNSLQVESITDNACFVAGGPPPNMGFVVADSDSKCVCSDNFDEFVAYYKSIVSQSFTDNLLPVSRSLLPLWQYQTSQNMDAGNKPSTVIRAATSLIDAYIKVDLREAAYAYNFPAAEMAEIYDVYNGPVSEGQRTDRITQIVLWSDAGTGVPLAGVTVTQVVGGQSMTLQIGPAEPNDDYNSYSVYTLNLQENERIVAVGATDCGDPNFDVDGTCLSFGYAFKTALVNASGAFESEGQLWNPMNYPEDGPWIVAPPLAQSRNATFLPYVIAFHGWATNDYQGDSGLGAKVPVWLYESLE